MQGKIILVTGGNRGLGLEVCRKIVNAGGKVILTARNQAAGEAVAQDLSREHPDSATALELDTADPASVDALVAKIKQDYDQQINFLVNNAAMATRTWTKEALDTAIATNYTGPVTLTLQTAPVLAPGAAVVQVSSGAGSLAAQSPAYREAITKAGSLEELPPAVAFLTDDPQKSAYSVSKAMLNRATQLLAQDPRLTKRGITINSVCPGWCRTDMGGAEADRSPEEGASSIFWLLEHSGADVTGGFYRDGNSVSW